jgi:hypothetical protein
MPAGRAGRGAPQPVPAQLSARAERGRAAAHLWRGGLPGAPSRQEVGERLPVEPGKNGELGGRHTAATSTTCTIPNNGLELLDRESATRFADSELGSERLVGLHHQYDHPFDISAGDRIAHDRAVVAEAARVLTRSCSADSRLPADLAAAQARL